MIKILNRKTDDCSNAIYVGRGSPLGNPFDFTGSKHPQVKFQVKSREEAISSYSQYLAKEILEGNPLVCKAVENLREKHKKGEDIFLSCYCSPLPCHAEVIKSIIENSQDSSSLNMIPLFKSHFSAGRSILTLDSYEENRDESMLEPDSIIQIARENNLAQITLVEDSIGGFMEAYKNCEASGVGLNFGVRLSFVDDATSKEPENEHKNVIFARNTQGYKDLIKLYTAAHTTYSNKFGGCLDYQVIKPFWTDNLLLAIPFYDSFIFYNNLTFKSCVPDFSFTKPIMFTENNELPFDEVLGKKVRNYGEQNNYEVFAAKTIYYKMNEDFEAWQVLKCMNRTPGRPKSLNAPGLDFCSSNKFSFESWKNANE